WRHLLDAFEARDFNRQTFDRLGSLAAGKRREAIAAGRIEVFDTGRVERSRDGESRPLVGVRRRRVVPVRVKVGLADERARIAEGADVAEREGLFAGVGIDARRLKDALERLVISTAALDHGDRKSTRLN